jgi:hypothetical protein
MNRITLDQNQLLQLKRFIIINGIKEEDVICEILDHFACKVEELLNENMYLSFEKAVDQAYYSFGYNGFKKMREQYEKRLKIIAWAEFKSALPTILKTKLVVLSFAWCVAFFAALQYVEYHKIEGWRSDIFSLSSLATMLILMGVNFYISVIVKNNLTDYHFDKNIKMWQKKVVKMPKIESLGLPLIFLMIYLKPGYSSIMLFYNLLALFSLINSLTRKETMKRMAFKFNTQLAHG